MMLAPPKGNAALNEKEKRTTAPASKLLLPMNNKSNEYRLIQTDNCSSLIPMRGDGLTGDCCPCE